MTANLDKSQNTLIVQKPMRCLGILLLYKGNLSQEIDLEETMSKSRLIYLK